MATINDVPSMWVGTSANYEALGTKNANAIYFLTDTRQIARGSVKYSQEAQIVDALPPSGIRGYIYFNTTDGIAYIYNGSEFKAIGVVTISDISAAEDADVPNVGAVKNYVAAQVAAGVANKVDKVAGKQLSTEDYTTAEKTKLGTYPENYSTVTALIDAKADPSDITDALNNYYTKGEVDGKVASVFTYKGTKATEGELPQSEQKVGDVWHVDAGSKEFAWDGTQWEELGGVIDLSGYYTKGEVDAELAKKADLTDGTVPVAQIPVLPGFDKIEDYDLHISSLAQVIQRRITVGEEFTGSMADGTYAPNITEGNIYTLTVHNAVAGDAILQMKEYMRSKGVSEEMLKTIPEKTVWINDSGINVSVITDLQSAMSTKVDKVVGTEGDVVTFGAGGAIADIGLKVNKTGGYANGSTPDSNYIVTETVLSGVVANIVAGDLGDLLDHKVDIVATGREGEIAVAKADGNLEVTGYKAGATTFGASGNDKLLANEQAIIDLLAWKTIPEA